tara:strand:+ start:42 stop:866 length:825 start_codon:yes stop_codon:yes gene_type:complete
MLNNKLLQAFCISLVLGLMSGLYAKYIATPLFSSNALVEATQDEYESSLSQLISSSNPFGGSATGVFGDSFDPASSLKRRVITRSFVEKLDPNKDFMKEVFYSSWDSASNTWIDKKDYEDLRRFLLFNLFFSYDLTTELIETSLLTSNKKLSRNLLSSILLTLNEVEKERVISESTFLIQAANEYLIKEKALISKGVFTGIIESETRRKLSAETRENLVVRIIDSPSLPLIKSKPRGTYYLIVTFIISFFLILLFSYRERIYRLVSTDLKKILN